MLSGSTALAQPQPPAAQPAAPPPAAPILKPRAGEPAPDAPAPTLTTRETAPAAAPEPTALPPVAEAGVLPTAPAPSVQEVGPLLAGWHGSFFLRDPGDYFRLYPKMRLEIDFNSYFGPGVSSISAASGGNALKSRLFLRRLNVEFAGEFLKRFTFYAGLEIGQTVANANGTAEAYASKPGERPTDTSARFQPVQTAGIAVTPDDVWINFTVAPWLNFEAGQFLTPFSMENRTSNKFIPFMERRIAIRNFTSPSAQELGIMAWGEIAEKKLNYEVGVVAGDSANRPQIDSSVDFVGRVFAKPLLGCHCPVPNAQIGMSARHGTRDPAYVGYDYVALSSGYGTRLWNPAYKDSLGRQVHVLPSGAQNSIGGELRIPVSMFDLRGEAYYVANNTREAIEGYQLTNTERLGQVRGTGFYVQLSAWPFGDSFVSPEPGMQRPVRVDFSKPPPAPKRGLEVLAAVGGVVATYDGGGRGDRPSYDTNTPGNPQGSAASKIAVYEYGFGINYWHSSYVRSTLNYVIYHTPGSGSSDNLAAVPGNSVSDKDKAATAHLLHELGARLQVAF